MTRQPETPSGEKSSAQRRAQFGFLLRFLLIVGVLYVLIALRPVDRSFVTPFSGGIAAVSSRVLNLIGSDVVTTRGTMMFSPRFAVDVKNGCNGLEAVILVVAAILSFPAPWRLRLLGAVASAVIIQAVNIVRVSSLFVIGRDHPNAFNSAHVVVWQSAMFLLSVVLFLVWSARVNRRTA